MPIDHNLDLYQEEWVAAVKYRGSKTWKTYTGFETKEAMTKALKKAEPAIEEVRTYKINLPLQTIH